MIISDRGEQTRLSPHLWAHTGTCKSAKQQCAREVLSGDVLSDSKLRKRKIENRKSSIIPAASFDGVLQDWPPVPDRRRMRKFTPRNQGVMDLIGNRHSRKLCGTEETVLELYHANLSMSKLVALIDQLGETRFALSAIPEQHRQTVERIEAWRTQPITKEYCYVFLAQVELNCNCGYEKKQASVLVAMGVDENGVRSVLGVAEEKEGLETSWSAFLQQLQRRGLRGVRLFVGDRCEGLARGVMLIFPGAPFQNSVVQFHRDVLSRIPIGDVLGIEKMLDLMSVCVDRDSAGTLVRQIEKKLQLLKLSHVAEFYETHVWSTLHYLAFPCVYWRSLRSNSALTELLCRLREQTRKIGAFSDNASAVHLVSARMRHIEATVWSKTRYTWARLANSV